MFGGGTSAEHSMVENAAAYANAVMSSVSLMAGRCEIGSSRERDSEPAVSSPFEHG